MSNQKITIPELPSTIVFVPSDYLVCTQNEVTSKFSQNLFGFRETVSRDLITGVKIIEAINSKEFLEKYPLKKIENPGKIGGI